MSQFDVLFITCNKFFRLVIVNNLGDCVKFTGPCFEFDIYWHGLDQDYIFTCTTCIAATLLHIMYRSVNKALRVVTSFAGSFSGSSSCSLNLSKRRFTCYSRPMDVQKFGDVRGDFMKWGSLGSCRKSSFASGFTPLKPKPLGSIIDIRRAELQSPEDLADIWDDVISFLCLLLYLLFLYHPALALNCHPALALNCIF